MKTVVLSAKARADLGRLDPPIARQITGAIERYAATGHGDVTALHGPLAGRFRLRVRDWRVRFDQPDASTIRVLAIEKRADAYR